MVKNSTFDFFIIERKEYVYCKIEIKGCQWLTQLWINYFRTEKLIMNLQLVYRYTLSLSKNETMFKEKQNKTSKNKRKEESLFRESKTIVS